MYFRAIRCCPSILSFNSTADESARNRLIADFDWDSTAPEHALGYRFDIVLRGGDATPMEH